jgi:hypothetical protein
VLESRKHGRFDLRWPQRARVQQPIPPPDGASEGADGLDWRGFRDLYVSTHRRHELTALNAYGAYRRERRWQAPREAGTHSVTSLGTAEQDWESEGGAVPGERAGAR